MVDIDGFGQQRKLDIMKKKVSITHRETKVCLNSTCIVAGILVGLKLALRPSRPLFILLPQKSREKKY